MLCVALMLRSGASSAQTDTSAGAVTAAARAVEVITADGVARHVGVLTADSTDDGAAPGHGLARTAQYVMEQFQKLGLQPGGADGAWMQNYPVVSSRLKLDYATSQISCAATVRGKAPGSGAAADTESVTTTLSFARGAYFAVDTALESGATLPFREGGATTVVAVSGRQTAATVAQADLHNATVLYIPAPGADSATQRQVLRQLYAANRVLVLSRDDSAAFVRRQQAMASKSIWAINQTEPFAAPREVSHWAISVRPSAVQECLAQAGLELARLQTDTVPTVRPLPGLTVWSLLRTAAVTEEITTGTNVIGILPGSVLPKQDGLESSHGEYLVISAHMDHGAFGSGSTDRISSRANDNASGVAALLELARAFGQLREGERPRRSIVLLAMSGRTEFWGSSSWLEANKNLAVAANINLDMLGRPAGDSVWVDGLQEVELPIPLKWLAAIHPELQVTLVEGGSIARPESDHFAFVRRAIPSLFFHRDTHTVSASSSGTPAAFDAAAAAGTAKLVFLLAYAMGQEERRLVWTAEGRRNLVALWETP